MTKIHEIIRYVERVQRMRNIKIAERLEAAGIEISRAGDSFVQRQENIDFYTKARRKNPTWPSIEEINKRIEQYIEES